MNSLEYIDYIRSLKYCCVCYIKEPIDPHHLISIGMGGNRKNPSVKHYSCVPLCRKHHTEYHTHGKTVFEERHTVSLFELAFHLLIKYLKEKDEF